MAKFLDGAGVQAALIEIIKNAESELYLIAPYMKISQQTQNYLKNTDKKNIQLTIISRSDAEIPQDTKTFLNDLTHAKIKLCDNLHAKCFLNEKKGLIATMNLHEHSQTHNWEMGISFLKTVDPDLYSDALKEIEQINAASRENRNIKFMSTKAAPQQKSHYAAPQKTIRKPKEAPKKGLVTKVLDSVLGEEAYCIRCGEPLEKYDLEKPLCDKCYAKWAKYKKVDFPEKFCHYCGQQKPKISYQKPICSSCYNELYK